MSDCIKRIAYQGKEIILIGTAHISKESVALVKRTIAGEQPSAVCIELDDKRYESMQNPKAWESTDIIKVIKSQKMGLLLASLVLSSYQKKMAKQIDTPVGGEMTQAIQSAKEAGATLVLADRDIQTTFLRIWRKLSLWEKGKLMVSLLFSLVDDKDVTEDDLQRMMQSDVLESAMASVCKQFPKIGEVLIAERDQYLAAKIKQAPGNKVIAVLGAAHVAGVEKEIHQERDVDEISHIPPKKRRAKVIGWIVPVSMVGLMVYAFALGIQTGVQQLSAWFVWTGAMAALCTALSMGHPLSILTSLVMAPFTAIHPWLACGWFTGLVEAAVRKPTVRDVQNVQTDILGVKGFFRNRVLKIIMVVLMANIGASIGTIVAGTNMIQRLL